MKIFKPLILVLIVLALVTSTMTWAGNRHHHHRRTHIGIHFAAPLVLGAGYAAGQAYYPYAHYSPYFSYSPVRSYYPPPVHFYHVAPPYPGLDLMSSLAVPTYIERDVQQESAQRQDQTGYWHYCDHPPGYYPDVPRCESPWQRVAPHR